MKFKFNYSVNGWGIRNDNILFQILHKYRQLPASIQLSNDEVKELYPKGVS